MTLHEHTIIEKKHEITKINMEAGDLDSFFILRTILCNYSTQYISHTFIKFERDQKTTRLSALICILLHILNFELKIIENITKALES